ncbi:unnamed protein product [Camellia sinensis]
MRLGLSELMKLGLRELWKCRVSYRGSYRWNLIMIKPRNSERDFLYKSRNPYYRYDLESFRVRRKDFYLLSTVTKLLKEFIPRLSHAADGLIFQVLKDYFLVALLKK